MKIAKRLMLLVLIVSLLFTGQTFAATTDQTLTDRLSNAVVLKVGSNLGLSRNTVIQLDAKQPLVVPTLSKGVLMVPVRYVAEGLGASVSYDKATGQTTLTKGSIIVRMRQGQTSYTVGKTRKTFPVALFNLKGRLYAPAQSLSTALGLSMKQFGDLIVFAPTLAQFDAVKDKEIIENLNHSLTTVQRVKSQTELKELLSSWQNQYIYPMMKSGIDGIAMEDAAPAPSVYETTVGPTIILKQTSK
jgi:hypothetical protein